ncbi:MAG: hypothetical protein M1814_006721 [Vezdaea aestivalis]|nr:MAG: hypothetical protein M1814_006721 [Vezdaea aestivalis]
MSSITLKISSLVIRTLSKPIANQIKAQAREHARFRSICVSFAQRLHRIDMRLRLGLLQDAAAIERQLAKEAAEAQAKKHKQDVPTVKTEGRTKADEIAAAKEKGKPIAAPKIRIRPLGEAKAIDSGANFISEAFLFLVGAALIVSESLRSRRKENTRREDVAEKLDILIQNEKEARHAIVLLEKEVISLRSGVHKGTGHVIPKEVWQLEEQELNEEEQKSLGWMSWLRLFVTRSLPDGRPSAGEEQAGPPSTSLPK